MTNYPHQDPVPQTGDPYSRPEPRYTQRPKGILASVWQAWENTKAWGSNGPLQKAILIIGAGIVVMPDPSDFVAWPAGGIFATLAMTARAALARHVRQGIREMARDRWARGTSGDRTRDYQHAPTQQYQSPTGADLASSVSYGRVALISPVPGYIQIGAKRVAEWRANDAIQGRGPAGYGPPFAYNGPPTVVFPEGADIRLHDGRVIPVKEPVRLWTPQLRFGPSFCRPSIVMPATVGLPAQAPQRPAGPPSRQSLPAVTPPPPPARVDRPAIPPRLAAPPAPESGKAPQVSPEAPADDFGSR